ncbi:hypothetical protein GLYMA_15G222000v4 [Glycine max]|nr:hypothetical protein GLYMA_15G222000v4 [Glycine max]KAG4381809.1 hypothetical protein GLYMA_15G222000v4 [Glycine max]KAG4381810.1 hypothetical protein GLYMA_15G222000v4 [Glycine max]
MSLCRSRVVPTLSFSIASKMILIGMIGTSSHIMYYVGVSYSSPTLASSIANLGPAFTFILAIIFRMEKIAAKSRSSQAKVIGSIISIAGAFVLTLYKSPSIIKAHSHDLSLPLQQPFSFLKSRDADWVIAGTCLESRTEYFINLHCLHWNNSESHGLYTFHVGTALKGACAFSPLQIVFFCCHGCHIPW